MDVKTSHYSQRVRTGQPLPVHGFIFTMENKNLQISENVSDIFRCQQIEAPTTVSRVISPVVEVGRPLVRAISGSANNATGGTLYTCSDSKDTYLTSACLATIKDASSTSTSSYISVVTENGVTVLIVDIPSITLTAQSLGLSHTFIYPIKLKRGSNINIANTTAVANITTIGSITFFEVDTN